MGDPAVAAMFKSLINHLTALAHDLEDKIEKLKKESAAKQKEIEGLIAGKETGEEVTKRVVELGKEVRVLDEKIKDLQKQLVDIYKQIGIYAIEYFKQVD